MKHSESVLIRSTIGWFEPRFKSAEVYLEDLLGSVSPITWSRTVNDAHIELPHPENVFKARADYGRGWRNVIHHLAFFFFVIRRLNVLQPKIIYACDADTLLPSLIWRRNRNCLIIFDQFDPLSARTQSKILQFLIDAFEYKISGLSDVQITANKMRIPKKLRSSWFEIKNLFPINSPSNSSKSYKPFILFYGGVLNFDRGLLACVDAISMEEEWEFHLYGQGELTETLTSKDLVNVFVHPPVSHDELMTIASNSHLFLAMYDPLLAHNKYTASNKLFEAAQLGLPILSNNGTTIGHLTLQEGLGWSVNYNDVGEINRVLKEFSQTIQGKREKLKSNLLAFYAEQKIEKDVELDRIKSRVNELLGGAI